MKTSLSARQQTVCDLVCLGWTNTEIAQSLAVSARTVEDHRNQVYRKMGVRNGVELLRKVLGLPYE